MSPQHDRSPDVSRTRAEEARAYEEGTPPFLMDSDTVLQILRMLDGSGGGSECERGGYSASALGATRGRAAWLDLGYEA